MAQSKEKQKEIEKLIQDVVTLRKEGKIIYEQKLNKYFMDRATALQNGIFDGKPLPKPKAENKQELNKLREKGIELMETINNLTQTAYYTSEMHKANEIQLTEMERNLEKANKIVRAIRNE